MHSQVYTTWKVYGFYVSYLHDLYGAVEFFFIKNVFAITNRKKKSSHKNKINDSVMKSKAINMYKLVHFKVNSCCVT